MSRIFTLSEAQTLLPVLEVLLRRAQAARMRGAQLEYDMQQLSHRIFLSGGMHVDVTAASRRRAEYDKATQETKETLAEIDLIGVQVIDIKEGLLDFPFLMDGRPVLLCWKMGETAIAHWHTEEEGFAARKSLDSKVSKVERLN